MSDDEIQFLGSKPVERTNSNLAMRTTHRPVTGIGLHIERSSTTPAYGMVFRRASTSVIHIGRRPGTDPERRSQDIEDGNAMFRCAVVSRKHAKIALSDSGHAYLIDLGSHHGTHVRKQSEAATKMLKPETPALLADGDIITFGKTVGKGEECVRPITARVELLYGAQATQLSIKPLVVPCSNPSPSSSDRSSNKSTGRYGVLSSSPSSSDDSSAPTSDQYSDIEEIPAPSSVKVSDSDMHVDRAFEVLKRLLPPSHTPCTPVRDQSPLIELIVPPPRTSFPSPPHRSMSPDYFQHSPPYSPRSLIWPRSPCSSSPRFSSYEPVGFDASQHDIFEMGDVESNRSRLSSPMDLASPSPLRFVTPPPSLPFFEPLVVGAWPSSRSSVSSVCGSPEPESHSIDHQESSSVPPDNAVPSEQVQSRAEQEVVVISQSHGEIPAAVDPPALIAESDDLYGPVKAPEEIPKQPETVKEAVVVSEPEVKVPAAELNALKSSLSNLQIDVTRLQNQRRKFRSRFNSNVHMMTEKVANFDERISDVDAQYTTLADQVEGLVQIDIPDLLAQIEALQDQAENVTHVDIADLQDQLEALEEVQAAMAFEKPTSRNTSEPPFAEREDVKASIQTMRDMVDEMRALRDTTQKQMAADLEAARVLRDEALIAAVRVETAPVLASLKRKRDDTDENEAEAEDQSESEVPPVRTTVAVAVGPNNPDVVMEEASAAVSSPSTLDVVYPPPAPPRPPRKRARKFAKAFVQTATAVTLGAVVTWSALAFS